MESFGLWYEIYEDMKQESSKQEDSDISFAMHVNFWSLEDIKTTQNIKSPYLDIGIKISNYKLIKKLVFFCPFKLNIEDVQDLSEKVSKKSNANIIFNDDCEIETKDNYTVIKMSTGEKMLIFPLYTIVKDVCIFENVQNTKDTKNLKVEGTKIVFDFEKFYNYVKEVEKLSGLETIYIRFRIESAILKDHIYFDSEPLNKSFESAFSGTRIVDFKINEKRNIQDSVKIETIGKKRMWAFFDSIHFLAMMPSSYNLTSLCEERMTCRELEPKLWDDYLGTSIDFNKGHVLAYHWRKKKKDNKLIDDFSCLVKVDYSKTKIHTIITYALSVVALGMLGSIGAGWGGETISDWIKIIIAIVILAIACILGKIK